jgi:hypothetical protein
MPGRGADMRIHGITGFLAATALVVLFSSTCFAESLQTRAIVRLQNDVVKALPADKKLTRVAVLDFKGDENNLVRNAVTSVINEKAPCKVMERVDFAKILAEQGLQLKDIMDEKTRIRHGRLKGVQGLLMGDVYRLESGFMSYHVKANVKLVDVEKGEILLSRDFEASAISPLRRYVIGGSVVFILLMAAIPFISGRARRRRAASGVPAIEEAADNGRDVAQGIDKIIGNVSEAKSRLAESGKTADAVELKEIERNLMQMKRSVTMGASGGAGINHDGASYYTRELDREVMWRLEDLERLSEKICFMASSHHGVEVGKEIGVLRAGVGRVEGDLRNRGSQFL